MLRAFRAEEPAERVNSTSSDENGRTALDTGRRPSCASVVARADNDRVGVDCRVFSELPTLSNSLRPCALASLR